MMSLGVMSAKFLYFTGQYYWRKPLYGVVAPDYPRHVTAANSVFRNLPVTSIDDGVFTASGGIYVNYVISGDVVYEIDVRNAAVRLVLFICVVTSLCIRGVRSTFNVI